MTRISPFKALRPTRDKAHLVSSRSYVSYSYHNLRDKLKENPYSFIHIIHPEFGKKSRTKPNTRERFKLVKEKFESFVEEGIFIKESVPAFYIYRQTQPSHTFTGIIAGISIDDYLEGNVKIHEHTLTEREKIFCDYLDVTDFNAEPVLITYPDRNSINQLIDDLVKIRPEYEFTTTDRNRHELWPITDTFAIQQLTEEFSRVNSTYIADGHHRTASSVLLGQTRRKNAGKNVTGKENFNFVMSLLIPESQLTIYPFHRLITDLNGHSPEEVITLLGENFYITPSAEPVTPDKVHSMGLYINNAWYSLTIKPEKLAETSPVSLLDPLLLNQLALEPIWNITDLKTDCRISFRGGAIKPESLAKEVDSGKFAAAFFLHHVSTHQLKRVADAGEVMPPKSTWVEPKLRSGLTIMSLRD